MKHAPERFSAGAQTTKRSESLKFEQPSDAVGRIFARIEAIQDSSDFDLEASVAELIQHVEPEVAEGAMKAVDYEARAKALATRARNIRDIFDQSIRRATLPVVTALAMNTAPALAQEANTERPTTAGHEIVLVSKSEERELKQEDVFDISSPLSITGEKMKALKREMLPEELILMLELHRKVWQAKNEWATVSWMDVTGNFKVEWIEGGPDRIYIPSPLPFLKKYRKDEVLAHTHPLKFTSFTAAPGLLPPSVVDISSCNMTAWENKLTQRVIDPRGVWEFRCDKQNSYFRVKNESLEGIETAGLARGLEQDDMAKLRQILSSISDTFSISSIGQLGICLRELDGKYPGLYDSANEHYKGLSREAQKLLEGLIKNDSLVKWLIHNFQKYTDEELAVLVKNYIDNSEQLGVYMSYMPFKELPKDKVLQKE